MNVSNSVSTDDSSLKKPKARSSQLRPSTTPRFCAYIICGTKNYLTLVCFKICAIIQVKKVCKIKLGHVFIPRVFKIRIERMKQLRMVKFMQAKIVKHDVKNKPFENTLATG